MNDKLIKNKALYQSVCSTPLAGKIVQHAGSNIHESQWRAKLLLRIHRGGGGATTPQNLTHNVQLPEFLTKELQIKALPEQNQLCTSQHSPGNKLCAIGPDEYLLLLDPEQYQEPNHHELLRKWQASIVPEDTTLDTSSSLDGDVVANTKSKSKNKPTSSASVGSIALIDQSDYYTLISLNGHYALPILKQACPFNLAEHFGTKKSNKFICTHYRGIDVMLYSDSHQNINMLVRWSFAAFIFQHMETVLHLLTSNSDLKA